VNDTSVLVVDDDGDLRTVLCELLASHAATSVTAGSLEEMVALGAQALGCQLAILDVNLGPGQPSGVDACRWLNAHSFRGRIVFLTGHVHSFPGVAEARALGVKVFEKPVSVEQILELLHEDAR
jgi:FixJ family two-component response regulator